MKKIALTLAIMATISGCATTGSGPCGVGQKLVKVPNNIETFVVRGQRHTPPARFICVDEIRGGAAQ